MQQFVVPQFIDVEDKIIGPITTRQFVIMLVGALLLGVGFKLFDIALFILFAVLDIGIVATLAFVKINGMSFHFFLSNILQTIAKPNIRVWKKLVVEIVDKEETDKSLEKAAVKPRQFRPTMSRLTELSLIVDTKGVYKGEDRENTKVKRLDQEKREMYGVKKELNIESMLK